MKRSVNTTEHKSEKTAEFIIPDLKLLKTEDAPVVETLTHEPPPVEPIQAKVVEEKKETITKLDQQIEDTKKEAVRQVDEKTVVFNLRQIEIDQKTKDLEAKKIKVERELNQLLTLKNSKFHEEMKLATSTLIDETKKIAPLEKNLEGLVENIQKVRLEMIRLFNQGLEDRKKSIEELAATKVEVTKMSSMVKETIGDLATSYQDVVAASKRTLNDFESDSVRVLMAKQEVDLATLEKERQLGLLGVVNKNITTYETLLAGIQQEINDKKGQAEKFHQEALDCQEVLRSHDVKMEICRKEVAAVEEVLGANKAELHEVKATFHQLQVQSEELKLSMEIMQNAYEKKSKTFQQIDFEIEAAVKRHDVQRSDEVNLLRTLSNLESVKAVHDGDIAGLQVQKTTLTGMVEELKLLYELAKVQFEERKVTLEGKFKNDEEKIRLEAEHKIQMWELQFTEHCVSRKAALKEELDDIALAHSASLLKLKDGFAVEAKKSILDIIDIKEFASREARIQAMYEALDVTVSKFVLAPLEKRTNIWKGAFYVTTTVALSLAVLLYRHW